MPCVGRERVGGEAGLEREPHVLLNPQYGTES